MKAIIFDLDETILSTKQCKPYLRTPAGRSVICERIISGGVNVFEKFDGIIDYINLLTNEDGLHVYIFSDSPKNYCLTLLDFFKINIHENKVYGSQHKPCVDDYDLYDDYEEVLVIGDSAKDVYFAHMKSFSSILLARLDKKVVSFYNDWTKPNKICTSLDELKNAVNDFMAGRLSFIEHDFSVNHKNLNRADLEVTLIPAESIGYSNEYWSNPNEWGGVEQRINIWFEVQRSIKVAKELSDDEIEAKVAIEFYNKNGSIGEGKPFKNLMWAHYLIFKDWVKEKNIHGNVYLVPVPPSAPIECNESFPINVLINQWVKYGYYSKREGDIDFTLINAYIVDRFWPTPSSHVVGGRREIETHLNTMAVFKDAKVVPDKSTIIIIDDIITSGTQMNAVATILASSKLFPKDTQILGYALAKTTHHNEADEDHWF